MSHGPTLLGLAHGCAGGIGADRRGTVFGRSGGVRRLALRERRRGVHPAGDPAGARHGGVLQFPGAGRARPRGRNPGKSSRAQSPRLLVAARSGRGRRAAGRFSQGRSEFVDGRAPGSRFCAEPRALRLLLSAARRGKILARGESRAGQVARRRLGAVPAMLDAQLRCANHPQTGHSRPAGGAPPVPGLSGK